jgi:peroxiredoxin
MYFGSLREHPEIFGTQCTFSVVTFIVELQHLKQLGCDFYGVTSQKLGILKRFTNEKEGKVSKQWKCTEYKNPLFIC